jgi:hypothetical protein
VGELGGGVAAGALVNREPDDLDQRRRTRRGEPVGHYAIRWVDGPAPTDVLAPVAKACRYCDRPNPGSILHADPRTTDTARTLCGQCQGEANRERMQSVGGGR